ncbi:hypothetical protein VNI00_017119 [Paramarasmius palmivorus]|uniref:Uncharacterized protein n=1 Tax=Paramarasmius palmivorus TaxID=297713 RepID=A0AAW0B7N3_9AGAR
MHEGLPLQLLSYTNLGRPNGGNKTPRLISAAYRAETTIADLIGNTCDFAIAKWCISPQNYFIIHLNIHSPMTEVVVSLKEVHLGNDNIPRVHQCIHKRLYNMFRSDIDARVGEGYGFLDDEGMELNCDTGEDDDDEAEEQIVAMALTEPMYMMVPVNVSQDASSRSCAPSPVRAPSPALDLNGPMSSPIISPINLLRAPSSRISSISSTRSALSEITSVSLSATVVDEVENDVWPNVDHPAELWSEMPRESGHDTLLGTIYSRTGVLVHTFFELEHDDPMPSFSVTGESVHDMAGKLKDVIVRCLEQRDFSPMLNLTRHFIQTEPDANNPHRDQYVTSGPGVEREVMHALATEYLSTRASEFFIKRLGDHSTLTTIPMQLARLMSPSKRKELGILGAIVRLSLIHGYPIEPINPLLLVFILSEFDLVSLSRSLVSTWYPELFDVLSTWNSMNEDDLIPPNVAAHLISFHDMQSSTLAGRTSDMHRQFSWQMLQHAIVGAEPVQHPYFQAFISGLRLLCSDGKINLGWLARAFYGGPAGFVCGVYTSNYGKTLRDETKHALSEALCANTFYQTKTTVRSVFEDFLGGTGVPCPGQLEAVKERFHRSINLDDARLTEGIGGATFRSCMFCWAASSVPFILQEGPEIEVRLIDDTDTTYISEDPGQRATFLSAGDASSKLVRV